MKAPGGRPPRVILSDFSDFLAKRWDPANAAGSVQGTPTGRAWVGRRNGSSSAMPVASPICWKPSERPTIRLIRTASQSCPSRRRRRSLGRPDEKPGARPGVSPARGAGAPADQGRMQEGVSRDGRRRQDRPQPAAQALDQLDAGDVLMVTRLDRLPRNCADYPVRFPTSGYLLARSPTVRSTTRPPNGLTLHQTTAMGALPVAQ